MYETVLGKKINVIFGGKPYRAREVMIPKANYDILPNWTCKIGLEEGFNLFKF